MRERLGVPRSGLVRLTMYATDLSRRDLSRLRAIRDRWIDPAHLPESTLIGVEALALPTVLFEVDAVCLDLG